DRLHQPSLAEREKVAAPKPEGRRRAGRHELRLREAASRSSLIKSLFDGNLKLERVSRDVRSLISDIVKAGLAGCTTGRSVQTLRSDRPCREGSGFGTFRCSAPGL